MTIFDYINSTLFLKSKIDMNCDDESQFSLYMLSRWCSFYSKEVANYVNQTLNHYGNLYTTKQEQYDFSFNILPKLKFKRLAYIKKTKKSSDENELPIVPEFCSLREYNNNVELLKTLSK